LNNFYALGTNGSLLTERSGSSKQRSKSSLEKSDSRGDEDDSLNTQKSLESLPPSISIRNHPIVDGNNTRDNNSHSR